MKEVGKTAGKFKPSPTPAIRSQTGKYIQNHETEANILAQPDDRRYSSEFLGHKNLIGRSRAIPFSSPHHFQH